MRDEVPVRRELAGVAAIGMFLGWLVMPTVDLGPDVSLTSGRKAPAAARAVPVASSDAARDPGVMSSRPSVPTPGNGWPERPATDRDARKPVLSVGETTDEVAEENPEPTEDQLRMVDRTSRVMGLYYDAARRIGNRGEMDDASYDDLMGMLERTKEEMTKIREGVEAGTLALDDADAQMAELEADLQDDALRFDDDKVRGALVDGFGRGLHEAKAEEAWEGIPVEDWTTP